MEHLFSPCTRLLDKVDDRDLLGGQSWADFECLQELDLDVSTEELLSAERAFTYADLYAMIRNRNKIVWLTPHTAVVRNHGEAVIAWNQQLDEPCGFCFSADGKEMVALARSPEHLSEICDVVLRLLAVSFVYSLVLERGSSHNVTLINAPTLAYMMEQCQSLKFLLLEDVEIDENHCRVLGDYSRPDLEIVLKRCAISDAGANALAEILGRNQGPTTIDCEIDSVVVVNGLRGNSRLNRLRLRISSSPEDGNRDVLVIAGALKENKGLVHLDLMHNFRMSDETWDAVCDSLKTHPTLEVLDLRTSGSVGAATLASSMITSRIETLLDMLKVNTSIDTMYMDQCLTSTNFYCESILPYLETNRLRPRLLAIQQTRPITYRAKVLGLALLSARTNANSFWMLLSGNAEVAFPPTTATTTPPTNLPTPAIVAGSANTATGAANPVATGLPAVNSIAPAFGQKRKARL
jgi:hypothetical protein